MKRTAAAILALLIAAAGWAADKTKLTIIHYMGEAQKQDALAQMIADFKTANPDVDVSVTAVQTANYNTTLKTMIAAGDAPDIIFGKPKEMSDLVKAGHIADLTGSSFLKNLTPSSLPAVTIDGKIYGVPVDLQTIGVFYNKDVFAKQGLKVPHTYSDFLKVADSLKAAGIAPFAQPYKDNWTVFVDFYADEYVARQDAPTFYQDIESGKTTFAGSKYFKDALTRFLKRVSYKTGDVWGTDNSTAENNLATGKAGMYLMGNWAVGDFVKNFPDAKIGYFPVPVSDDVKKNAIAIGVDDCWMISSASKSRAMVNKFFDYLTSSKATTTWMKTTNTIGYTVSASSVTLDPISNDILALVKTGKTTNFHAPVLFSSALEDVFRNTIVEAAAMSSSTGFNIDTMIKRFDTKINQVKK
jgi:raffinose/stachyose/melibiose transport system substrate-binding protein